MLIVKTRKDTIQQVIANAKHALSRVPKYYQPGEILLVQQTKDNLPATEKPIRYRMQIQSHHRDEDGESERLFGRHWEYIIDCSDCFALKTPFHICDIQISGKNYKQGGPFVYVHPADEKELIERRLLEIAPL